MLTFSLNNHFLALDSNASIRLQWINPACQMDSIGGDVGLGIDIPVNEINRAILGNPERFEKYNSPAALTKVNKFPGFEIRYSGVLLMSGTLNITKADGTSYQGWLQSEVGVMGEAQREKFITEMEWPEAQEFENKGKVPGYTDETDDYGVPFIRNAGFWDGKGREVTVGIPYLDQNAIPRLKDETGSALMALHWDNFQYMVNAFEELDAITTEGEGCVVSPSLFLRYVLKETLRKNQWFINRNDMIPVLGYSFTLFNNLMVYNNFNIVGMDYTTVEQDVLFWDEETRGYDIIGYETVTFVDWGLRAFKYADLLPKIAMKDFLLGIQNSINMVFYFRKHHKVDIVDRNAILTQTPIDLNVYRVGFWEMGDPKEVTLKFLPEYDKDDQLFATGFTDLTDRRYDFKEAVNTYADLEAVAAPEFGDLRMVKNTNSIYEYKFHVFTAEDANRLEDQMDVLGWEFVSTGPQPYLYGESDEIEEIKSPCSMLQRNPALGMLEARQRGNMATMRNMWNDFSFRLISVGLLHSDSLFWEGENGLFENRWRRWANFWKKRQPVAAEFNLPLNALVYLSENLDKPAITIEGAFIIEEIEVEIGMNMVGVTKIKGYKI